MLKIISEIFVIGLIFTLNSFAQFQMSVWGGVNNTSFGGNPPEDASYGDIYGLAVGGDFDFQPSNDFVITLEPSFEQQGSQIELNIEEGLQDTSFKFNVRQEYLGLALFFKVNTGNFYVGSGVNLQYLLSAKFEFQSDVKDVKEDFQNYNAIAFFNVGYKIPIGVPAIFFELRYLQGLMSILSESGEEKTENYLSNFKSTGLRLSTGIIIPL